ncbi:MAG: four helix bundle protein [Acidobacteriota bacterium]
MATVRRFQDLEAWQVARQLTRAVYSHTGAGGFARDFGMRDQVQRAAVSVMSNIAEGFERGGNIEFVQFLSTAKGSAAEVESLLYAALDQGYLSEGDFEALHALTVSIRKLLQGLINYLKKSPYRGPKYKQ